MSISPTSILSKPEGSNKVPTSTFAYLRARFRHRVYTLIIGLFKKSALSQADLARRLGYDPAQLSRLLSGPGNLTLDTISDILFAIGGLELGISVSDPLGAKNKNIAVEAQKASSSTPATPITQVLWSKSTEDIPRFVQHPRGAANTPSVKLAA